ncbi:MAG: type VI secretion system baseplate subunit TssG [Acidobacteria bacterium]|nr:type VI secretion system baseplate subunit TssG [Acidobacteriota bacterium]
MATTGGTQNPDVELIQEAPQQELPAVRQTILAGQIRTTPWEFQFFQTVRWLIRMRPDRGPTGRFHPPSKEIARYRANPAVSFPASEIQGLEGSPLESEAPLELTVNFMGMFGPLGALPLYYSEYIRQRLRVGDSALRGFLDIYNHRMISLFYRAWEKYRFGVPYERGEPDRLSHYLMDLIGLGTKGLQNRNKPLRDDSLVFYTGLLSLLPRSGQALQQVLSDYFDVPITVEQFMGQWYPLERSSQCQFDRGDSYSEQLGVGAIVGDEVWDPQSGIRLRVGPLTLRQYLDFLPNGTAYRPLKAITRFFTNEDLTFETHLILKREEVPRIELGSEDEAGPRLGWVTWSKNQVMDRDPDETLLRI